MGAHVTFQFDDGSIVSKGGIFDLHHVFDARWLFQKRRGKRVVKHTVKWKLGRGSVAKPE